jgi:glycine cleavage system transcriptional repressor
MKTRFPHAYVLNVMSDDHPGIVAAVSRTTRQLGGNIDALSQTVVGGYFTLIMVISLPQAADPAALAAAVEGPAGGKAGLQVTARPFIDCEGGTCLRKSERFVATAFGKDRPGIIALLSEYMAGKDVNITDLYWQCTDDDFVMVSQVEIPPTVDIALLQADLEEMGRLEGFMVKLQHENVFVATNQLRLVHGQGKSG